ncbi:Serine/threonine-protein kinase PknH [Mycobacterium marinum]|nr:Serine/threonine-protein kinase PknH [Mycobacterium marinum]
MKLRNTGKGGAEKGRVNPLLSALAAAIIVAVAAGAIMWSLRGNGNSGAPTDSPKPPDPANSMLLSPSEIEAIIGASGLGIKKIYNGIPDLGGGENDIGVYWPQECLSAAFNTMRPTFAATGYTSPLGWELTEADGRYEHWVDEGVITLSNTSAAQHFFSTSAAQWQRCIDRDFSFMRRATGTETWHFGAIADNDGIISIHRTAITASHGATTAPITNGRACTHAIGSRMNIVADVLACGWGTITNEPDIIVERILNRIRG